MGSTKEGTSGQVIVQEDFELLTFDFVSNPSTSGAFLRPMNEGTEPIDCGIYCRSQALMREIITELT